MIDTIDVIRALTGALKAEYPEIKIENADISTPDRPCFYINLISSKNSQSSVNFVQTVDSFDVIYFAETRYEGYIDLLTKKKELLNLLQKPLKITETVEGVITLKGYVMPDGLDFNLNTDDYVLNTVFDIEIIQKTEIELDVYDTDNELMDELYLDKKQEV